MTTCVVGGEGWRWGREVGGEEIQKKKKRTLTESSPSSILLRCVCCARERPSTVAVEVVRMRWFPPPAGISSAASVPPKPGSSKEYPMAGKAGIIANVECKEEIRQLTVEQTIIVERDKQRVEKVLALHREESSSLLNYYNVK